MIRATYDEMRVAANDMTKNATEYKKNVDDLYIIVENLAEVWKGTDNLQFVETANSYKDGLKALGDVVTDYGTFLEKSANLISEAQEDVASAAGRL